MAVAVGCPAGQNVQVEVEANGRQVPAAVTSIYLVLSARRAVVAVDF